MQNWLETMRRNGYYRGKPLSALMMNLIFAELFLFIIGYLWFVQRTRTPLLSLFLTIVILGLLTAAAILQYRKSYAKKKTEARRKAGREFLTGELRQLNSKEFQWQIMRLLLQLDEFTDIQSSESFLKTEIKGKKALIACYHSDCGEEISKQRLTGFLNQAQLAGYSYAIYVTSGTYSESCRDLAGKNSFLKVQLMDMEDLLDQMERAGMFPDEEAIDGLIDKKILTQRKKLQEVKKEILTPKRIRTYLAYSLLFFILSRLFSQISLYYILAAVIFFVLALFIWFYRWKHPEKSKEDPLPKKSASKSKSSSGHGS